MTAGRMNDTHNPAAAPIYPNCPATLREIRIGGMSKSDLLNALQAERVQLNEAALTLFTHGEFTTSPSVSLVLTVELTVADLGFDKGATIAQIHASAAAHGLSLCRLELAPALRLQYLDQPEGHVGRPPSQNRAPPGSITVASTELSGDEDTPKGFYLRRIEGALWLRAYRSGPEHVWSPEDHFVFCHPPNAAL